MKTIIKFSKCKNWGQSPNLNLYFLHVSILIQDSFLNYGYGIAVEYSPYTSLLNIICCAMILFLKLWNNNNVYLEAVIQNENFSGNVCPDI